MDEISMPGTAFNLFEDESIMHAEMESRSEADLGIALVRHYLARQTHRGGDNGAIGSHAFVKCPLPTTVEAAQWAWTSVISTAWRVLGEHINVLEARAVLLTLRWRYRRPEELYRRYLHLCDSRVCIGMLVKGRTSSRNLRRVLVKIAALNLASHCVPIYLYVNTKLNPADRPSRAAEVKAKQAAARKLPQRCDRQREEL